MQVEFEELYNDFIAMCQERPTKHPKDVVQDAVRQHLESLYRKGNGGGDRVYPVSHEYDFDDVYSECIAQVLEDVRANRECSVSRLHRIADRALREIGYKYSRNSMTAVYAPPEHLNFKKEE